MGGRATMTHVATLLRCYVRGRMLVDEGDGGRVRVGVTLRADQHRWCKQRALDTDVDGGFSAVVRAAIDYYRQTVHLNAAIHDVATQEEARP